MTEEPGKPKPARPKQPSAPRDANGANGANGASGGKPRAASGSKPRAASGGKPATTSSSKPRATSTKKPVKSVKSAKAVPKPEAPEVEVEAAQVEPVPAETPAEAPAEVPAEQPPAAERPNGLKLLLEMAKPRRTRAQLLVALLCGLLGFALVTQVHSQAGAGLSSARQADLVDVLDNLSAKSDQLRSQIADEQNALSKLTGGAGQTQAALEEAQQRAATLQILAGTVGASGTGIDLRIDDPDRKITADVLLDTLEELRDAGAEAIEITGAPVSPAGSTEASAVATPGAPLAVRLVASSYFVDSQDGNGVVVDGTLLAPPYDFLAIGDPPTMSRAMGIPGGVLDTLKGKGASGKVTALDAVRITALHTLTPPKYARPASSPGTS